MSVELNLNIKSMWYGRQQEEPHIDQQGGWFLQIFTMASVFEPGDEWTIMIVIEVYNCRQQHLPLSQANALGFDSDNWNCLKESLSRKYFSKIMCGFNLKRGL